VRSWPIGTQTPPRFASGSATRGPCIQTTRWSQMPQTLSETSQRHPTQRQREVGIDRDAIQCSSSRCPRARALSLGAPRRSAPPPTPPAVEAPAPPAPRTPRHRGRPAVRRHAPGPPSPAGRTTWLTRRWPRPLPVCAEARRRRRQAPRDRRRGRAPSHRSRSSTACERHLNDGDLRSQWWSGRPWNGPDHYGWARPSLRSRSGDRDRFRVVLSHDARRRFRASSIRPVCAASLPSRPPTTGHARRTRPRPCAAN
jgi:hypothetical protein